MKFIFSIILSLCSLSLYGDVYGGYAYAPNAPKINWLNSYEVAVNESKSSKKPILLFFTGSDWCSWCHKLENEALNTEEFAKEASNRFIFVKIDFPLNNSIPPHVSAQNKQLQKKYDIKGFPTIVLLDSNQQQIGTVGYRPGGGKAYATHLFKMVSDYQQYRNQMQNVDNASNHSYNHLKKLYEKSKELALENEAQTILKIGMKIKDNQYFLTERYRFLAEEGKIGDPEALTIKQQLLASDPKNENKIHYQIAVIDFEKACENMDKDKTSIQKVVQPLTEYIDKFGKADPHNLWKLQMIISQMYLEHNNLNEALRYAQYSYQTAPDTVQHEIATAIKGLEHRLSAH
ncbi:Disulfide bond reductase DsbH precursor [Candidatus Rubidus massiliensis]|nr:Disulfide bond reductase DsbH precursor [Candidatus Rubidus massiliensis]